MTTHAQSRASSAQTSGHLSTRSNVPTDVIRNCHCYIGFTNIVQLLRYNQDNDITRIHSCDDNDFPQDLINNGRIDVESTIVSDRWLTRARRIVTRRSVEHRGEFPAPPATSSSMPSWPLYRQPEINFRFEFSDVSVSRFPRHIAVSVCDY